MKRFLVVCLEALAGLVGLAAILMVGLIWRLNEAPISTTFMTPTIQVAISSLLNGSQTEIETTLLEWDNAARSMSLHAENIRISKAGRGTIAIIPSLDIALNPVALLVGQFIPRQFNIDHPQIELDRHSDGKLYFGDVEAAASGSQDSAATLDGLQTLSKNLATAIFTRELRVNNLIVDIHDEATRKGWALRVPEVVLDRVENKVVGHAIVEVTQSGEIAKMEVHYEFDRAKGWHHIAAALDNIVPAQIAGGHPDYVGLQAASIFNMPIAGNIVADFNKDLVLTAAEMDMEGGSGSFVAPDVWDGQRPIVSATLQARYVAEGDGLTIQRADVDFGDGTKAGLTLQGHLTAERRFHFTSNLELQHLVINQLSQIWPKPVLANAREWVLANMRAGVLDTVSGHATIDVPIDHLDDAQIIDAACHMVQTGASINFIDGLPLAGNVDAEADCDMHEMRIQVKSGGAAGLKAAPFQAVMSGLMDDTQYLTLPAKITGSVRDALALIDMPSLRYAQAVGLKPDDVAGSFDATANFKFPLLKALQLKDIAIKIDANLSNLASHNLLKGKDLSQGNMTLDLTTAGFEAKGSIAVNKVPLQVAWEQNFTAAKGKPYRQILVNGVVRDDQWQAFGIDAMGGTHGPSTFKIQITSPTAQKSVITGVVDMTAAEIHINQLNWRKTAGATADFKFTAEAVAGKDIKVPTLELHGAGLNAKGSALLDADGNIKNITLDPFILGRSNAGISMYQSPGPNGLLRIDVSGASFDVTGLRSGHDIAHEDPRPKEYHLHLDTLYTSEKGYIAPFDGFAIRDALGWSAISLHGNADGAHPLLIELKEQDGVRHFTVTCDDFGKALQGMGFTNTVRDGDLKIYGVSSVEHPRVIDGTVKVGGFVVRQLPVMALLLNATSPFGFTDILTDS
ncbi:MAG: hypothetical protein JO253_07475, partial [Alphaproteobacteria bacterium]|nr:hypothetical protein [Alphaproteobacteria bacterium]